ncbi:MAG: TauD/TfdA family dioxygenase [Pseudomonadota bacterium]|nr:TauD/TfdA family dioxygenase [Pseudomonadota bacterium]
MDAQPLNKASKLPLLITGGASATPATLAAWASANRAQLDAWLHRSGGVLFRGFGIQSIAEFRDLAVAARPELAAYIGGDSPRNRVADKIYTSTEFPPQVEIGLHNEMSYASWWPSQLFFFCQTPATTGGETQIGDARRVLALLDGPVRDRFAKKGVLYEQHLRHAEGPPGPGKSWQETFETQDRAEVEVLVSDSNMDWEWTELGLRTAIRRPGIVSHPDTGELVWFNQANLWHAQMGGAKKWVASSGEPHHHARYGDGSDIPIADLLAVEQAYQQAELTFRWEAGDVLVLDNHLTVHGRKPFTGPRAVFVAMA